MTSVADSLNALGLDDEEKRKPSSTSVEASLRALEQGGTAEGLGKAALSAVPKGIFNAIGAPADFLNLGKLGGDWLAGKMGATPEQIAQLAQVRDWMPPLGPLGSALPTSAQVQQGVEQFTGKLPLYEPQTRPEKALDTAIQMAIGLGKPTASSLMKVVVPGTIGTEVAGAMSNDNPLWRGIGGLLGGGVAAGANAYLGAAQKAVRDRLGMVAPAEIAAADELVRAGQREGFTVTGPEAFGKKSLLNLAGDVAASRTGGPIMERVIEQRPGQVRSAAERLKDLFSTYRSPGEVGQLAEKTAADVLQGANVSRTARTSPYWQEQKVADLTATEQLASNAQTLTNLQGLRADLAGQLQAARGSTVDAVQQGGQMQALANEFRQLTEKNKVPGLGAVGNQTALQLSRQSRNASEAAADFGAAATQRKSQIAGLEAALEQTDRRIAALQPKTSDVEYGVQSIIGQLDSALGLLSPTSKEAQILSGLRKQLEGATTATAVDSIYKTTSKLLKPGAMATGDEKLIADVLGPHVPALGALVDQVSGPIRQGRQLYREITQQEIDPLRASSVGRMAPPKGKFDPSQPGDAEKAVGVIAKGTDVDEIRQLHTHLNAQNPQAFPAVARGLLETTFEKATKPTLEGENVKMGAKWANDLRGKDQQRANFDEILRGVAAAHGVPADQLVQGTNVLFDVLKATGKIPGVGSPTAGRIASGAELSRNPITAAAETLSTQPATAVGRWAKDVYFGRRNAELAQWFTDPDTVQILVKMAKLKPDGVTARYYLGQLLNLNKEVNTTDRQ